MEYKYRLVVFVNKKKTKEIEIVSSSWIYSDKLSSTLLCKFMPGPYNNEKINKLVHMVKNGLLPEDQWPSYPIELKGRAYTYEDAEKKAIILEKEPYVYSTDNEDRAKQKANQDKKYFQFKSVSQESVSQQLDESHFDINSDIIQNIRK
ncbi:hypothetical protein ALC57_14063 [Trachymyrmex cornetzi]|uniref:Uncharacterized protein n=1 Tax=Trachymyrmex cornetzi TaxID=471704 RepID=A0A151IYW0_9HYME|nr:hypothetical protein ALC57_14063 [Trachymyrmex cornetzi]